MAVLPSNEKMCRLRRVYAFCRIPVFTLALQVTAIACAIPHYRVGKVLQHEAGEVALQISIPLVDFAPDRLLCLAEAFTRAHPRDDIWLGIFSAYHAAQQYQIGPQELSPATLYSNSELHGFYVRDSKGGDNYIAIVPDGRYQSSLSSWNTHIDLPPQNPLVCRLTMYRRCVLAFRYPEYLSDYAKDTAGQITITGHIARNGIVSATAALEVKVEPPERASPLAAAVIENFKTWRFEPAGREDDVRITYYFDPVDSLSPLGSGATMRLPDEIRVEALRTGPGDARK